MFIFSYTQFSDMNQIYVCVHSISQKQNLALKLKCTKHKVTKKFIKHFDSYLYTQCRQRYMDHTCIYIFAS